MNKSDKTTYFILCIIALVLLSLGSAIVFIFWVALGGGE